MHQHLQEVSRFERETKIETSQNHLTGFIQEAQLNRVKFNEQRVMFDNTGTAMNPTDGAGITSALMIGQDRGAGEQRSRKAKRRELKKTRQKFGEACSGNFKGPWAIYEGMEEFKS